MNQDEEQNHSNELSGIEVRRTLIRTRDNRKRNGKKIGR